MNCVGHINQHWQIRDSIRVHREYTLLMKSSAIPLPGCRAAPICSQSPPKQLAMCPSAHKGAVPSLITAVTPFLSSPHSPSHPLVFDNLSHSYRACRSNKLSLITFPEQGTLSSDHYITCGRREPALHSSYPAE
jgi:hypothetical protein